MIATSARPTRQTPPDVELDAGASEDDVRRARRGDSGDREHVDEIYTTLAGLPPDRFPLITAHAAEMVAGDGDERFRFAIDMVVDGLVARAARQ